MAATHSSGEERVQRYDKVRSCRRPTGHIHPMVGGEEWILSPLKVVVMVVTTYFSCGLQASSMVTPVDSEITARSRPPLPANVPPLSSIVKVFCVC